VFGAAAPLVKKRVMLAKVKERQRGKRDFCGEEIVPWPARNEKGSLAKQ